MRPGPVVYLAFAAVLAVVTPARAESCGGLAGTTYEQLTTQQRGRFLLDTTTDWARMTEWKYIRVRIRLDRAPHLVKRIVEDCPGVKLSEQALAEDERRLASSVLVQVTSYAAVLRLVRLPAVRQITMYDERPRKLRRHEPEPNFQAK